MYAAPVEEQLFALATVRGIADRQVGLLEDAPPQDLVEAILLESARIADEVFAPLNRSGDVEAAQWRDGQVTMPEGFRKAYQAFCEGGWNALTGPEAFGGQGLSVAIGHAVNEQLSSANGALTGCPQLTWGAVEALVAHGSDEQRALYLAKLVSGQWAGTMNLTEPQAGTDVGAIRTTATVQPDGTYRIRGQKIFITFGEHDLAENIIHLVLARTPGAPSGSRGLSLFIVPKLILDADGNPGERNDIRCVSIEHKLGLRASPTCMLSYGDEDRCIGYLIGEEQGGLRAMFTMMNNARINVGMQGVAYAERAYQHALSYARERVQSRPLDGSAEAVTIIRHPDVQRMLLDQRAHTQAIRALLYYTAEMLERAHRLEGDARRKAQGFTDLLTPVAKAYATDIGMHVTSSAIQVFGGVGFIEETGIAQHYRDVRITPIYEGTNGVQALDLVNRKLPLDGGVHWRALIADFRELVGAGDTSEVSALAIARAQVRDALDTLEEAAEWMAMRPGTVAAAAGATDFLTLFGAVTASSLLLVEALEAQRMLLGGSDNAAHRAKITTAAFHATNILPRAVALGQLVRRGNALLSAFEDEAA